MTTQEKSSKVTAIQRMIVDLKKYPTVKSKETIQKLQQQIDVIINQ